MIAAGRGRTTRDGPARWCRPGAAARARRPRSPLGPDGGGIVHGLRPAARRRPAVVRSRLQRHALHHQSAGVQGCSRRGRGDRRLPAIANAILDALAPFGVDRASTVSLQAGDARPTSASHDIAPAPAPASPFAVCRSQVMAPFHALGWAGAVLDPSSRKAADDGPSVPSIPSPSWGRKSRVHAGRRAVAIRVGMR